jgi:hypothetical protein
MMARFPTSASRLTDRRARLSRGGSRAPLILLLSIAMPLLLVMTLSGCGGDNEPRGVRLVKVVGSVPENAGGDGAALSDTTIIWVGEKRARAIGNNGDFLVHGDSGILYSIDHAESTVVALRLSDIETVPDRLAQEAEQAPQHRQEIDAVLELADVQAAVRPTSEFSEIDGYHCRKYVVNISMGQAVARSQYWVTRDIEVDRALFRTLTHAALLRVPGSEAVLRELDKLDGLPVLTTGTVEMAGQTTRTSSRLIDVEYGRVPSDLFELPAGYILSIDADR